MVSKKLAIILHNAAYSTDCTNSLTSSDVDSGTVPDMTPSAKTAKTINTRQALNNAMLDFTDLMKAMERLISVSFRSS